ncbi:MAG: alkaline phosphatase family protein [Acidobacteriota bacterium]|nr:alkaline phosphatase family protein [Acidobacteriota bacterium]
MVRTTDSCERRKALTALLLAFVGTLTPPARAQRARPAARSVEPSAKPRLVVLLVVDQMRADYVDKFRFQWTGGLKRLVEEGAWFRNAAYPYAATETCVGHATISTGALPATHGMISNEWWDRDLGKRVTCTADPTVKNVGYAGATVAGGDSAVKMLLPAFAEELKFQSGEGTRVVTFSLKARASITMGGRTADAVTWFDPSVGAWTTSSAFPVAPFVEEYARAHPVSRDYGKTWAPLLPASSYLYPETAVGAVPPSGYGAAFPHPLRGKPDSTTADALFYSQWQASPYADAYLAQLAEAAVDKLGLGRRAGTDFLAVSFSSVDYVGHAFGPRSWEIQDILARLDRDLGTLFSDLDRAVGKGNYVVAFSADHGVVPIPDDLIKSGREAGWLNLAEVRARIEAALEPFHFAKPIISEIAATDLYFAPGVYDKLRADPAARNAVLKAIAAVPGVAAVYGAEELEDRPATRSPLRTAQANSFFPARSGDLLLVPQPYWPWDSSEPGKSRSYGTTHGTPYAYDQRVPVLFMGYGIRPGEYFASVTPADIAPTLAALCRVTLAAREGHILSEALEKSQPRGAGAKRAPGSSTPQ